jgi:hypothetical protein
LSQPADNPVSLGGTRLGVIYLAFGEAYLAMALLSFRSLRASNPQIPACIVTNVVKIAPAGLPGWRPELDHWLFIEADAAINRTYKTGIHRLTPFDKTIYLDCDTLITGSLQPLFRFLDHFDVCLRLKEDPLPENAFGKLPVLDDARLCDLPHWNGGVVAFRTAAGSAQFFENWSQAHRKFGNYRDQQSLVEAVFRSDCKVLSFDGRWNMTGKTRHDWSRPDVVVLHYMSLHDAFICGLILQTARAAGIEGNGKVEEYLTKVRRSGRKTLATRLADMVRPRSASLRKRLQLTGARQ